MISRLMIAQNFIIKGLIIECFSYWGIFPVGKEVSIISLKSGVSVVDLFSVRESWRGSFGMNT